MLLVGTVGKEDSGFDGHREDDFFDQPGFGSARGGDGGTFDKLAEARFADAEESWESRARVESATDNDGMHYESILEGIWVCCWKWCVWNCSVQSVGHITTYEPFA